MLINSLHMLVYKKKNIIIIFICSFVLIKISFFIGAKFFTQKNIKIKQNIQTIKVKNGDNDATIVGYGNFSSGNKVAIIPEASSDIDKIYINGHSKVKKGDLIMTLKERNIVHSFEGAKLNQENANKIYTAAQQMFEKNLISESELNTAKTNYELTSAIKTKSELSRNNIEIRAPFDGTLIDIFVNEGQFVNGKDAPGGQNPVYSIIKDDKVSIAAPVQGKHINHIKKNQNADIICDDKKIDGYVSRFENVIDPKTGYFSVIIEPKRYKDIIGGDSCSVKIYYNIKKSFIIPSDILSIQNEKIGIKIIQDNIVLFKNIDILSDNGRYMVVGGLTDDDLVIVSGNDLVKDGDKINDNFIVKND